VVLYCEDNVRNFYFKELLQLYWHTKESIKVLKEYDGYLASLFSIDYWADEWIGIAEEKLSEFSLEEWQSLVTLCDKRDLQKRFEGREFLSAVQSFEMVG
jgi:hypothetical protein